MFSEPIDISKVTVEKLKEQLKITLVTPESKEGRRRLAEDSEFEWDIREITETSFDLKLNFSRPI